MIKKPTELFSVHPLIPMWALWVSNSEMSNFSQGQGKSRPGGTRRRTLVRRTREPAVWRRDCGKGPFMDGNYL